MAGVKVWETDNHFQAQNTLDARAGDQRRAADHRGQPDQDRQRPALDGSGPRAGIGEIDLPAVQPGSSIMPGKVNPVIAESVCQVVGAGDRQRRRSPSPAQGSNFELNVMMPVAAYNLLQSIDLLADAADNFADQLHRRADGDRARPGHGRAAA